MNTASAPVITLTVRLSQDAIAHLDRCHRSAALTFPGITHQQVLEQLLQNWLESGGYKEPCPTIRELSALGELTFALHTESRRMADDLDVNYVRGALHALEWQIQTAHRVDFEFALVRVRHSNKVRSLSMGMQDRPRHPLVNWFRKALPPYTHQSKLP